MQPAPVSVRQAHSLLPDLRADGLDHLHRSRSRLGGRLDKTDTAAHTVTLAQELDVTYDG